MTTKREEAHIRAIIASLEKQQARLEARRRPHEEALNALDDACFAVIDRLAHAKALLGEKETPLSAEEKQEILYSMRFRKPAQEEETLEGQEAAQGPNDAEAAKTPPDAAHNTFVGKKYIEYFGHTQDIPDQFGVQLRPTVSACPHPRTTRDKVTGQRICTICNEPVQRVRAGVTP